MHSADPMNTFDFDFKALFIASAGEPVNYQGERIYLAHKVPVCQKGRLLVTIEATDSPYLQGVAIQEDVIGIEDRQRRTVVYEHYSVSPAERSKQRSRLPFSFEFEQKGTSGELLFFNVALREDQRCEYWDAGCAMKVEPLANGYRFYCNDFQRNDDFSDLVFRVECLPCKEP